MENYQFTKVGRNRKRNTGNKKHPASNQQDGISKSLHINNFSNVNGLNSPIKIYRVLDTLKNKIELY